ncbi:hypothetical protein BD779DRAFT_1473746 [Infundibulicybe gibba]|nr:hypothetical protein BD779DRAFT_1473746 [Infundibulicybe gibba]
MVLFAGYAKATFYHGCSYGFTSPETCGYMNDDGAWAHIADVTRGDAEASFEPVESARAQMLFVELSCGPKYTNSTTCSSHDLDAGAAIPSPPMVSLGGTFTALSLWRRGAQKHAGRILKRHRGGEGPWVLCGHDKVCRAGRPRGRVGRPKEILQSKWVERTDEDLIVSDTDGSMYEVKLEDIGMDENNTETTRARASSDM